MDSCSVDRCVASTDNSTFQLLFYAFRPGFIRTQKPTRWHALNLAVILSFDAVLVKTLGWYSMFYLLISSLLAGSLHPCAAHFIAEHYLMDGPREIVEGPDGQMGLAQETTSYYGKLNWLCYNVGYHNEHHDFPSVPWTRLPELRRIAYDFYSPLPSHKSWPYVTWKFITDPSVGMFSRAKRTERGEKIDPTVWYPKSHVTADAVCSEADKLANDQADAEMTERGYGSDREENKRD